MKNYISRPLYIKRIEPFIEKKDPDVMIIAHQYRIKHLQIRILPLQIVSYK